MPRTDTMPHGIWLDHLAFAKATLLPDADLPWLDAPAFAQWLTKSHGLLGRQMVLVPVSAGIVAWLRAHPDAMQSMRQAKGPLGMVRVLCAHPDFTGWLQAMALNLRTALPPGQTTLVIPGPAALMALLLSEVPGISGDNIDPDDAEDAAVYLANALRAIPVDALEVLAMDVRVGGQDLPAGIDTLQKVAAHYQWRFGVRARRADGVHAPRLDFVIVDQLTHDSPAHPQRPPIGAVVDLSLAAAAMSSSAETHMQFVVVRLPDDQPPEHVLSQLRALTRTP